MFLDVDCRLATGERVVFYTPPLTHGCTVACMSEGSGKVMTAYLNEGLTASHREMMRQVCIGVADVRDAYKRSLDRVDYMSQAQALTPSGSCCDPELRWVGDLMRLMRQMQYALHRSGVMR